MSSTSESPSIPDHWAHTPAQPREPRYLCLLDGTTIEGSDARRQHDEHFHAKTDGAPGRPERDDELLRREALQSAVASQRGAESGPEITARAETILGFLRGQAPEQTALGRPRRIDDAPAEVHEALDRIWQTIRVDESGLKALEGRDADEVVLEVLRKLPDETLRASSFAASALRALAQAVRADRG